MEGQGPGAGAEALVQHRQLFRVVQDKDLLALPLGQTVEGEFERLFKQRGQPLGKGSVLGHNPNLRRAERVAVKQHTVCLRLGAALSAQRDPAQLCFYISRKGHSYSSKIYRRSPRKMRTARSR